ncbi:MAG TPA: ABC transporter substrate-binding protein [Solirubrobacteraceae bacterium]|nr:ABC transporter substrate-binding protein [Solirubrobacteraceae bacterium]
MRLALTIALAAALIAGCGGVSGGDRPNEDATLLLDSAPAAAHAGIYLATERGYDEAEGVRLEVRRPGAAVEKLRDGRADFALLRVGDLARARERGADVVGVYAVLQRPEGPVLCVTRSTLEERRPLVRATIRALQRGYAQAQAEPDSAVAAVLAAAPRADREQLAAQLDAVAPAFTAGARAPGELRPEVLARGGIDVEQAFDFDQVGPLRNP